VLRPDGLRGWLAWVSTTLAVSGMVFFAFSIGRGAGKCPVPSSSYVSGGAGLACSAIALVLSYLAGPKPSGEWRAAKTLAYFGLIGAVLTFGLLGSVGCSPD
jgi:hypothetical protein